MTEIPGWALFFGNQFDIFHEYRVEYDGMMHYPVRVCGRSMQFAQPVEEYDREAKTLTCVSVGDSDEYGHGIFKAEDAFERDIKQFKVYVRR